MANANKVMPHACWAQMKTAKDAFGTCPFCTDKQNRMGRKNPERMLVVCQDCTPKEASDCVEAKDYGSHGCTVCRYHVGNGSHMQARGFLMAQMALCVANGFAGAHPACGHLRLGVSASNG